MEELALDQFEDRQELVKEQSTCRSVSGSRAALTWACSRLAKANVSCVWVLADVGSRG